MISIVSTEDGRIFMGGNDGCVYELQYQVSLEFFSRQQTSVSLSSSPLILLLLLARDGILWPSSQVPQNQLFAVHLAVPRSLCHRWPLWCVKLLGSVPPLSRTISHASRAITLFFAPVLLGEKPSEILQLCYDTSRQILYSRSAACIQAYLVQSDGLQKAQTLARCGCRPPWDDKIFTALILASNPCVSPPPSVDSTRLEHEQENTAWSSTAPSFTLPSLPRPSPRPWVWLPSPTKVGADGLNCVTNSVVHNLSLTCALVFRHAAILWPRRR